MSLVKQLEGTEVEATMYLADQTVIVQFKGALNEQSRIKVGKALNINGHSSEIKANGIPMQLTLTHKENSLPSMEGHLRLKLITGEFEEESKDFPVNWKWSEPKTEKAVSGPDVKPRAKTTRGRKTGGIQKTT